MRSMHVWSAALLAVALAGCTTPLQMLGQNIATGVVPTQATQVLIVLDGKVFGEKPTFGSEGQAYLDGLGEGLQQGLPEVQAKVIQIGDPLAFGNPMPGALRQVRPSHVIRVWTASLERQGLTMTNTGGAPLSAGMTPVSAVWEMDATSVTLTDLPATAGKHAALRIATRPIYKMRTRGDTCTDSDTLATRCGVEMGKFMADKLRAAHVMLLGAGS
jgi:hypothetical protein